MKTKALFPGSFDPFTLGHLNILNRALTMFDEIVIGVGENQTKSSMFSDEKKIDIIRQCTGGLKGVSVEKYDCLTVDFCRKNGIHHIIRGVRNFIDFDNEKAIADANRKLAPEIETVIIPTAQEYAHISSTAVRDLIKHNGNTAEFLPKGLKL